MIKKITICDVASFNSSTHTMEPLKEVNYIYGANGSGKTTISRLLEKADEFHRCSVEQDIGVELPVVVYNNDFVFLRRRESKVFLLWAKAMSQSISKLRRKRRRFENLRTI